MSQYRAYPAYKDSGVEWIGLVPEHWEVKRLKHLISQCQNGVWGDDPLEDGSDTLCIRVADFDRDNNVVIYNPSTYRQITKEHQDSRLVSKGDILLEKSGGGAQTLVGANVRYLGEEPAVCSNFVAVIKPSKKAESAWLNYLMASMYALKINLRSIKQSTGIQNLDSEQYLDEGVAAPSLDEQATIATALDRETARIDALIEKKTRFIELLKEKRQALITHAVTKGLDPNVKMKDSGVEWIGQVPVHWEVKPICRVTSVNDDVLPDSTTDDTPIRYVDISSVGYMEGIKQASDMCFADAPSRARRKASSGDVIISTVRTYLKAVAAVTDEYADCVFSTGFAVLRARHLDRSFLKWMVLNELLIQAIEAHSEGLSYPAINASALVKLKSVIPPPEEQASIAATLDRETARIDALIGKAEQSITLLKERRSAFITAAVTGQIDLRGKQ